MLRQRRRARDCSTYVYFRGQPARAVDDLLASHPSGDLIVVLDGGRLVLLDARGSQVADLGRASTHRRHSTAAFGANSLVYTRVERGRPALILRDLDTERERTLSVGLPVTDVRIPPGSSVVFAYARRWRAFALSLEAPSRELGSGGRPLGALGDGLVVLRSRGDIVLTSPERVALLAPSTCGALATWPPRNRVLVRCETEHGPRLELRGPDERRRVDGSAPAATTSVPVLGARRFIRVSDRIVDLETTEVRTLPPFDRVLGREGWRVLIARRGRVYWSDLETGEVRSLGRYEAGPAAVRRGTFVFDRHRTFDLASGSVSADDRPIGVAFDDEGRRLVPLGGWFRGEAYGPFAWVGLGERAPGLRRGRSAEPTADETPRLFGDVRSEWTCNREPIFVD